MRAPRVLAISRRAACPGGRLEPWLESLAGTGIDAVQLREKDLDDRALYELARAARRILPGEVRLLINGRVDVALAAGADGVHLPSRGLPTGALRRRFGPRLVVGRSTHTLDEIAEAAREGADYVTYGPVWSTPGKGAPVGTRGLAEACALGLPVVALGGVTISGLEAAAAAGAAGVAGIRVFLDPESAAALARRAGELFGPPPDPSDPR